MRRMWSLVPVCAIAAVVLTTAVGADRARGTTGATGLPQPKEVVPRAIGDRFTGRYLLTGVDRRAKVISGELAIEWTHTDKPFLLGFLLLFKYDQDGRQSSFVSNAYPFSYKSGKLSATLAAPGSGAGLGRLTLRLPTGPDEQAGRLGLAAGGDQDDDAGAAPAKAYNVTFRRREESASATAVLPPADQTDGAAPARPTRAGLGPKDSAAYGRYELLSGDAQAGQNAGLYAPVVRLASRLGGDRQAPDSGSLTLFGNTVKKGAPLVPAGIVTLHRPGSNDVAYLTDFKWGGDQRSAVIRGGSTDGPAVGRFVGTLRDGTLDGTLVEGTRRTDVRFVRRR
jgi:hypothetical protein